MSQHLRRGLLLLVALVLGGLLFWPRPVLGAGVELLPPVGPAAPATTLVVAETGAHLFAQHCAGCHLNGGNVIRRGKTLRLAALRRAGLEGPEAVARVAALGQGQMGGYGDVLGPGGAEAVGAWVWRQAEAAWPKSEQKITRVQP